MPPKSASNKTVTFRLSPEIREDMDLYCEDREITQSIAIRRFLREGLNRWDRSNTLAGKFVTPQRDTNETERLSCRIPADTFHRLKEYTEERDTNQSEAIRHLIVTELAREGYTSGTFRSVARSNVTVGELGGAAIAAALGYLLIEKVLPSASAWTFIVLLIVALVGANVSHIFRRSEREVRYGPNPILPVTLTFSEWCE